MNDVTRELFGWTLGGAVVAGAAWWCKAVFKLLYRPLP